MGLEQISCTSGWSSPDRMESTGSRCVPAPSIARRRTTMQHHAGLDVSLEETSVCIVDGAGKIIRETQVASEPEALVGYFSSLEIEVVCIGLEAGPLSQWLHAALTEAGFEVVLLETRHVKAALSADGQNRPPRCARDCATPSDGLVPAGALQDAPITGGAGDHYGAQDPVGQAHRYRA